MRYSELNIAEKLTKLLFSENFSVKSLGTHRSIHFNFKFINVSSNKEYGLYDPDSGGGRVLLRRKRERQTVNFLIIANWSTTSSIVKFKKGLAWTFIFQAVVVMKRTEKAEKKSSFKGQQKMSFYFIESESCILLMLGQLLHSFFLGLYIKFFIKSLLFRSCDSVWDNPTPSADVYFSFLPGVNKNIRPSNRAQGHPRLLEKKPEAKARDNASHMLVDVVLVHVFTIHSRMDWKKWVAGWVAMLSTSELARSVKIWVMSQLI